VKLFNKRGDSGETSLLYGQRTPKSGYRCHFNGAIDESVSALGLARSFCKRKEVQDTLLQLQKDLFIAGAELAVPEENYADFQSKGRTISEEMVESLTGTVELFETKITLPKEFIIPGSTTSSAAIDMARTAVRRTERIAVQIHEQGLLPNEIIMRYLNRMADLLFVLARYEETD